MGPAFGVSSSWNEPTGGETILIVGASARAAAMSARRGGLNPWAADMFGDQDLRACCPVERIDNYPNGLEGALAAAPAEPWMYTGALENHPDLVDRMAALRPLYGVGGESLRAVRDPQRLAAAVQAAGFAAPRCSLSAANVPTDGSWLSKPRASAGGHHIALWYGGPVGHAVRADATAECAARSHRYFQEQIEGLPASAVYVGTRDGAICLGITRQLLGVAWCGLGDRRDGGFRYCGSIGPLDVSVQLAERFEELGDTIARSFGLVGLFGVDAILSGNEIWTIEVNPRYTASIEILERASSMNALTLHVQAFSAFSAPSALQSLERRGRRGRRAAGRAVLYAPASFAVGGAFLDWAESQNSGRAWPIVADIPALGMEIRSGQPIATLFAEESDERSVLSGLKALAVDAYRNLAVSPPSANNSRAEMS